MSMESEAATRTMPALLQAYNACFERGDAQALREVCADERGAPFVHFDNHAGCESLTVDDHVGKVAAFLDSGQVVPLGCEVLDARIIGDAGLLVARVGYGADAARIVRLSLFAERVDDAWRIVHLHWSVDPDVSPAS